MILLGNWNLLLIDAIINTRFKIPTRDDKLSVLNVVP